MKFKATQLCAILLALVLMAHSSSAGPPDRRSTRGSQSVPAQTPGKVVGVQMREPRTRTGMSVKCPTKRTFYGQIGTDGRATVKYTWVTSDGRSWPVNSLTFSGKANKQVSVTWELGKPGQKVNGWIRLEVLAPNKLESTRETVSFVCD